ncbi:Lipoprotein LpqB, GerMN domain containing protein [Caldalkalibacillus thermarum TA2.A1]|uniref:GerMN domain-containing protein n=1 Tax=Caldalkalibacillus thermarum (strain TA2.A1) TaxID=986075 RepID=F5LAJ1_CALTT|nr:GerMN domain-containing protein [Caldalkalibacillus thermarum]EGL81563.1 Lipoprotein LpqB, GerMN domain containing protein [Caldalkalibacillus thermarum TA2.A1]QZT33545.1 GerMN domain-containing protein [Caldalkalibacillus thermarum TA2.A1]
MGRYKVALLLSVLVLAAVFLSGCIFGPSRDTGSTPIDPPQEDYFNESDEIEFDLKEEESEEGAAEQEEGTAAAAGTTERTIFVFDHEGRVVPLTVKVPQTEGVAKQALEYLVVDGPVTEQLPDGMRAVLPPGTEMTVKIDSDEKTAIVDFSAEFKNYNPEDEKGILEAITYTLTEFDNIEKVKIMINGYYQDTMPVNGTPINQPLSRKDGINLEVAEGTQIGNNSVVTLYFRGQSPSGNFDYYVPVSRVIPQTDNLLKATIEELISGPLSGSGLYSLLSNEIKLLEASLEKDTAVLNFSQNLINEADKADAVPSEIINAIVLSVTELEPVKQVKLLVEGSAKAAGLSEPVSRPDEVNAASF